MSELINYNGEGFLNEMLAEDSITLVDFSAIWCGPCQMLKPVLEEVAKTTDYKVIKVDVDQSGDLAVEYEIRSVPTVIVFKNGKLEDRLTGFMTKDEIIQKVNKYL